MEPLPLSGRTLLVTRQEAPDGPLTQALEERGARVTRFPLVRHEFLDSPNLEQALASASSAPPLLVFVSPRAIEAFQRCASRISLDTSLYLSAPLLCAGPSTAARAKAEGFTGPILHPPDEDSGAKGMIALLRESGSRPGALPRQALLLCGGQAGGALVRELRALVCEVTLATVYRTEPAGPEAGGPLRAQLTATPPDAITLASGSASLGLLGALGAEEARRIARRAPLAVLGPSAAEPLKRAGVQIALISEKRTFEGLAGALARYFREFTR